MTSDRSSNDLRPMPASKRRSTCVQGVLRSSNPLASAHFAGNSMNGTVHTQAQGNPVPVAYGGHDTKGMFIGSAVISGGILAEDQF